MRNEKQVVITCIKNLYAADLAFSDKTAFSSHGKPQVVKQDISLCRMNDKSAAF